MSTEAFLLRVSTDDSEDDFELAWCGCGCGRCGGELMVWRGLGWLGDRSLNVSRGFEMGMGAEWFGGAVRGF